jgi:limonene-1,2-epoxide hydrolase
MLKQKFVMGNQTISSVSTNSKQIVLDFIDAMNGFDYQKAKNYVTDDLSFVGVLGTRDGAEAYFNDMQKMKFHYNILKSFADGNDVCLFYDIDMGGQTIFCCGWYQLQNDKIKSFRVVFDPRPLLEQPKKN